jgi:dsDNA-binding SOS-regulon protein
MPIKPHPTDPDKVVFVSHKPIPSYEKLLDDIEKLKARIRVLEKALVKSEEDYEQVKLDYWRLLDENKRLLAEISINEPEATVDEAWQKYCEVMMPQKATHVYPLAGAMYMTFVTGWNAALKEKK